MKHFVVLALLLLSAVASARDQYVFSPVSSLNELSDKRVRSLSQLPDGRMAIVTEGLINLYDGTTYQYLHYDERAAYRLKAYSGFHRLYLDSEQHLWLKNQFTLFLFDLSTESFIPNIDSLLATQGLRQQLSDFFVDNRQGMWYLTDADALMYRPKGAKSVRKFLSNASTYRSTKDPLFDLVVVNRLVYLFYRSGRMVCYGLDTGKEWYTENPFEGKPDPYTNTLMVVPYRNYLYQVRNGAYSAVLHRYETVHRRWEVVLQTDYSLNTLTVDRGGTCWISSHSGLWRITPTLSEKRLISPLQRVDGYAFESEISTQYNDRTGGLWVGTLNRGLLYHHPDRFRFSHVGTSLFPLKEKTGFHVHCFAESSEGLLVGTSKGAFRYQPSTGKIAPYHGIPPGTTCTDMHTDKAGRTWIATTTDGIYRLDGHRLVHFQQPQNCFSICETPEGRILACTEKGIVPFEESSDTFKNALIQGLNGRVFRLTALGKDELLGIGDKGLFVYHPTRRSVTFPAKNSPLLQYRNHHYHCLYTDSRGWIWMGTMDGLNVYQPSEGILHRFSDEDGLINNSIRSLVEDSKGRIWVSTSNGISCIQVLGERNPYRFTFANYNKLDGVLDNEFDPGSVLLTSDNRLLWGGLDGFNELSLDRIDASTRTLSAAPIFTGLSISGTRIKPGKIYGGRLLLKRAIGATQRIDVGYFQNYLELEFSALNYINPTQTRYRYKLEGADEDWQEQSSNDGTGRVYYTGLGPGTYKLRVMAANNDRNWGKPSTLTLVIHPPFWKTVWAYCLYGLLVLCLLYLGITQSLQRHSRKLQERQQEALDQMKYAFFTNIGHELRTPLTLILTPLDSLLKKMEEGELKTQLTAIQRNAIELLKRVNQLLDFRKLEMKGEALHLSYCNVGEFVEAIAERFAPLQAEKGVTLRTGFPGEILYAFVDKEKLLAIVNNLLSNAFKFTPSGGKIDLALTSDVEASTFTLRVSDTGCGIPEEDLPHIFDRFFQAGNAHAHTTGSGIGLYLLREYVLLHEGTVTAESNLQAGSTFTVILPTRLSAAHGTASDSIIADPDGLKILLVEDHPEFSAFVQKELSQTYTVLVAADGIQGLNTARNERPDLIISDVMMPGMSGTELCQRLKADVNTSHIPVILLTAKTSDQAQIEGFKAGADAYVTKPFNMDLLQLRIQHLLKQQQERKEAFRKSLSMNPEHLTPAHVDQELIQKALVLIERNMDKASYSVEQLSKELFMDRTNLYRKLSAIVGQTPTEFIRTVRLKRAAQLLEQGLTVTEVAELVGFRGTTSYFSKCFQEEFGTKPSQYKASRRPNHSQ
jgi:DNA-binding response OmpR family regulator/nitrogen-specific signal transduction histidine kinase